MPTAPAPLPSSSQSSEVASEHPGEQLVQRHSPETRPVMLRQLLCLEGNQVQNTYELRLDDSLPKRERRDRNACVNGCQ
jgi:hypothetical protein